MPYEFIDDMAIADVAFIARGKSLEELLSAAADATMNVMVDDLASIARTVEQTIEAEAEAEDLLLVNFLQELHSLRILHQLLGLFRLAGIADRVEAEERGKGVGLGRFHGTIITARSER